MTPKHYSTGFRMSASGKPGVAKRRDLISLVVSGITFALVNAILILTAAVG